MDHYNEFVVAFTRRPEVRTTRFPFLTFLVLVGVVFHLFLQMVDQLDEFVSTILDLRCGERPFGQRYGVVGNKIEDEVDEKEDD